MAAADTRRASRARFQWVADVLASKIAPALKVLCVALALHKNDATGQCNPAVDTLAKDTGNSGKWARRTVQRQLLALREIGWITYPQNAGGKGKSTQY